MSGMDLEEIAAEAEAEQNGATIEEIAADAEELEAAEERIPPVPGSASQLSLLAGGEEPTSASMKLRGGAIPLEGEFEKGDHIRLIIEARVSEVHFIDNIDTSGYVLGAERRHVARIDSVRRADG